MSWKLKYSWKAREDMLQVWKDVYEASGEKETADQYLKDLDQVVQKKESFPFSAQKIFYGDLFTGFYMLSFKAYRVFYRIQEDTIEVSRVMHYRRDFLKVLLIGE